MLKFLVILILYHFGYCFIQFEECADIVKEPFQVARIVSGKNAKIVNFPYHVAMFGNKNFRCGGSVIAKNWIVTAAHCLQGNLTISAITFRIGSSNYKNGGKIVNTAEIFNHPDFNIITLYNDVALVRTVQDLIGINVKPIKLPNINYKIRIDKYAIISGWGYLQFDNYVNPFYLQYVAVNIIDQEYCKEVFAEYGLGIHESMFCAAGEYKDACEGDSGGPIVVDEILIGIISWGLGCADSLPGVYTYLAHPPIRNWIKKISQI